MILHKKEMPRRINAKNWLQNELCHKIPKNGILSLTKVKLTVSGWRHGFKQVSCCISLYPSFFGYNIIVTWMYVIFVTLFNDFDKHREKYTKLDFVKFISFEINYFVGTGCFLFLRNIDTLFFQVIKVRSPPTFLSPLFLYFSLPLCQTWQLLLDNFLGWAEIKFTQFG